MTPKGITYGEYASDYSWRWRIALVPGEQGDRIEIEAGGNVVSMTLDDVNPRCLEFALTQICDEIDLDLLDEQVQATEQ